MIISYQIKVACFPPDNGKKTNSSPFFSEDVAHTKGMKNSTNLFGHRHNLSYTKPSYTN